MHFPSEPAHFTFGWSISPLDGAFHLAFMEVEWAVYWAVSVVGAVVLGLVAYVLGVMVVAGTKYVFRWRSYKDFPRLSDPIPFLTMLAPSELQRGIR